MCLAVPAQIISLYGTLAVAEMSGVKKQIDVTLTPEVVPGDWVVVHVGYALQRIDPEKAQETLAAMRTARQSGFRRHGGVLISGGYAMQYTTEFRNKDEALALADRIRAEVNPARQYRYMEFCGGHTHVLARWGLTDLLPANIRMIHGPGCPVCVLPIGRVDMALDLALNKGVTLCTYADMMRVPGSGGKTLFKAKAQGADVRMVYSPSDALKLAQENPDRQVVFFAIGFETTTPPTALVLKAARAQNVGNFSVVCSHVITPAAMRHIMLSHGKDAKPFIDGIVGPAHVSAVIGEEPYRKFVDEWKIPVVICGFEPLDMLLSILMLVRQTNAGKSQVENEFSRAVPTEGNRIALSLISETFVLRDSFAWRGLGRLPASALALSPAYAAFDAEKRFGLIEHDVPDNKACECGAILRGEKEPRDCKAFGTVCTPIHPIGACMVSSEGACAAYFSYESRRIS